MGRRARDAFRHQTRTNKRQMQVSKESETFLEEKKVDVNSEQTV